MRIRAGEVGFARGVGARRHGLCARLGSRGRGARRVCSGALCAAALWERGGFRGRGLVDCFGGVHGLGHGLLFALCGLVRCCAWALVAEWWLRVVGVVLRFVCVRVRVCVAAAEGVYVRAGLLGMVCF